jgi:hypothetical protein
MRTVNRIFLTLVIGVLLALALYIAIQDFTSPTTYSPSKQESTISFSASSNNQYIYTFPNVFKIEATSDDYFLIRGKNNDGFSYYHSTCEGTSCYLKKTLPPGQYRITKGRVINITITTSSIFESTYSIEFTIILTSLIILMALVALYAFYLFTDLIIEKPQKQMDQNKQ